MRPLRIDLVSIIQNCSYNDPPLCRKRQRLEELGDSKTVQKLAELVGRGKCSVAAACEIAQGVVEDHHQLPNGAVRAFASLGANGNHPQNAERDLHRWLRCLYGFQLQTYVLKVDLQIDSSKVQSVAIRVLAPHEIFHSFASMKSTFAFNSLVLGNLTDSERIGFWEHIKTLRPWASHPIFHNGDGDVDLAKLVGVTIHGDGAVMKRDDECFVWSVSSCYRNEGTTKDPLLTKIPVAMIPERHMLSKEVTYLMFRLCLTILLIFTRPSQNFLGWLH